MALASTTPIAQAQAQNVAASPTVTLFSKHLGWMGYEELADTVAELGFDGVDLTVRPGGHVNPERVDEELPRAVEILRSAGLKVPQITTRILTRETPHCEDILRVASALDIQYFRYGYFKYDQDQPLTEQLAPLRDQLKDLAGMCAHYGIQGGYHNHSGWGNVGSAIWDLNWILDGVAPEWLGSNLDLGHIFAEGSRGAWWVNYQLIKPRIKMSAVKDFAWVPDPDGGFDSTFPPLGEGLVRFTDILALMKEDGFAGPFSIHQEYPIEGDDDAARKQNRIEALRRDLQTFRGCLREVDWA
jgi:sugar phosphate isomerase/epimerase